MKKIIHTHKIFIYFSITVLWSFFIFSFSFQDADTSSSLSSGFGQWIIETFFPFMGNYLEKMTTEQIEFLHHILRKCGHFTEFFILGIFSMQTFAQTEIRGRYLWAEVMCMAVASTDETIQLFSDGRSGQISDVLLDSIGAAVGIFVMYLLRRLVLKQRGKA